MTLEVFSIWKVQEAKKVTEWHGVGLLAIISRLNFFTLHFWCKSVTATSFNISFPVGDWSEWGMLVLSQQAVRTLGLSSTLVADLHLERSLLFYCAASARMLFLTAICVASQYCKRKIPETAVHTSGCGWPASCSTLSVLCYQLLLYEFCSKIPTYNSPE